MAFWKKQASTNDKGKKAGAGLPFPNAPLTAYDRAQQEWFDRCGSPVVDKNRYFVGMIVLGVAVIAMAVSLAAITPLKTVVPYVIKADDVGRVEAVPAAVQNYNPDKAQRQYFVATWARHMLSIDPATLERDLQNAFEMTRSKAIDEFREWIKADRPIARLAENPQLSRTVAISSVAPLGDDVVIVRCKTTERAGMSAATPKNWVITVHFGLVQPKTETEILANPLGLFITHFAINEELG